MEYEKKPLGREVLEEIIQPTKILSIEGRKIYTLPGNEKVKEDFYYRGSLSNLNQVVLEDGLLSSLLLIEGFSTYPMESKFLNSLSPSREEGFSQKYDSQRINSLNQAFYFKVIGSSVAMPIAILPVTGKVGFQELIKDTNTSPNDFENLSKYYYKVLTNYRQGRILGFEIIPKKQ